MYLWHNMKTSYGVIKKNMSMKRFIVYPAAVLLGAVLMAGCVPENPTPTPSGPDNPGGTVEPDTPVAAVFSVSDSQKVRFSPGNLQYVDHQWRFAEHQGDVLSVYNDDTCDLFRWSAANTGWGVTSEEIAAANTVMDYRESYVDYGTNPQLIESLGEGWRTLSAEEWDYLLNKRTFDGDTGLYNSYVNVRINGQYGVLIFPDGYTQQLEHPGVIPDSCVFLPASGYRTDDRLVSNSEGHYRTASPHPTTLWECITVRFYQDNGFPRARLSYSHRTIGVAVRLVRDVE